MKDKSRKEIQQPPELDRMIHEPARLKIISQLYVVEKADFIFIMRQTGLTQGNVSGHLSKLEKEGYVKIKKGYSGKRPLTMIALTELGRIQFRKYLVEIRSMLDGLK